MKKIAAVIGMAVISIGVQATEKEPTPQQQLTTTCNAEAHYRELKGQDRSRFVSACLAEGRKRQGEVMKSCNEAAQYKKADERRKFMAECQRG